MSDEAKEKLRELLRKHVARTPWRSEVIHILTEDILNLKGKGWHIEVVEDKGE